MIRTLRMKLVIVSMLSLLVVLAVILGVVNLWNYQGLVKDADSILRLLAENQGDLPETGETADWSQLGPRHKIQELPYEIRYFSVLLGSEGELITADTGSVAAVDRETAGKYAKTVFTGERRQGFIGDYRYLQVQEGENTRIIFLDYGGYLYSFRSLLSASVWIALIGLLGVFCLLVVLSRRIVQPVLEGYEKQKRFITDAGHELKTPIAIIHADAEVLETELGENEWVEDIQRQTKRLARLTNDLIYLSRMEEQQKQTQMTQVAFSPLVEEEAAAFQSMAKAQNKTFILTVQPGLSLMGEEKSLRQLVTILMDNAVKYSPEGGLIQCSLDRVGKQLRLVVENTAEEVSKEMIGNMFDRFYRGDASRSSQTEGYGIGLSVAKAVVQSHKGRIGAAVRGKDVLLITVMLPAQ